MKFVAKFVMLLAVLAFCLPADGEILIYRTTMKCFGADGERIVDDLDYTWEDVGDERTTGYYVLDVVYDENGEVDYINTAERVEYWRDGRDRWYEHSEAGFDVERIEIEDRWGRPIVYWVLEDWWSDEGEGYEYIYFVMYKGKARMVNIGLGWTEEERREVASALDGCFQFFDRWIETGDPDMDYLEKGTCCATLRLHPSWTRLANLYEQAYDEADGEGFDYDPFNFAVGGVDEGGPYGIVTAWLEWLGYEEIGGWVPAM